MVTINPETEQMELRMLLDVLKDQYEADYTNYRSAYLLRRTYRRMELNQLSTITELTNQIIHSHDCATQFMEDLSISVTNMYRCPNFFKSLIQDVFPVLKTYPRIKIWHAGCASGEEVLSLAILLKEHHLYEKSSILATDISTAALEQAKKAIYPFEKIKQWTEDYSLAGGQESFTDYYSVNYNFASFDKDLLSHVVFKQHDLTSMRYPESFHIIICRNVLIYFNNVLQTHVINHFQKSLIPNGFLGLGEKENVIHPTSFTSINKKYKIYKNENHE